VKKQILLFLSLFIFISVKAQVITDTVSTGAGYSNQVWYSLQNDNQGSAAKNNWDIAIDTRTMGMTFLINSVTGTQLWSYPNADTTGWATLDTNGLSTWTPKWNSDTSWDAGAFDRYLNPLNEYDAGWGNYNPLGHTVTGDTIYIVKLASGSYKKCWIQSLAGGVYTIRFAGLGGESDTTIQVNKADYAGKNFVYCNLSTAEIIDREPAAASWDLLFGQYTTFIPQAYPVTGVLSNGKVLVAKAAGLADASTYNSWNDHTFSKHINTIGYDWKKFADGVFQIEDSLAYFVKDRQGAIWKLIFTGFGGSANGNYIFTKEKISAASIETAGNTALTSLTVYPNPSIDKNITLVIDLEAATTNALISIIDLSGKSVYQRSFTAPQGLQTQSLHLNNLTAGLYMISVDINGQKAWQKLIIQ